MPGDRTALDRISAVLIVAIGTITVAGCGGGGGGGESALAAPPRPETAPLAPPQDPSNFLTAEFDANSGLGLIDAQQAYALGAYGDGVIVAIVDSGIETTHPDLDANISPASINIIDPGAPLQAGDGHGTLVAGIVAAEKNDIGMHGVAFDATILAIRADDLEPGIFLDPDIAAAVDYAVDHLAHIINLSLGGAIPLADILRQALIDATRSGVIIVAPTGNEPAASPAFPAANAGDADFNGLLLAVGAVDPTGTTIASFSTHCGATRDFCLVAPGEDIYTTDIGNSTALVSGTSFSSPHVSGAAALLIQLFPNLDPQQVVQILLRSATDLGVAGVDDVYGHGLLNLAGAVQPLGTLAVPLADAASGPAVALDDTTLALGPAFGDALTGSAALGRAIALDDFDRPYPVDLASAVAPAARTFNLDHLVAPDETRDIGLPLPLGASLHIAVARDDGVMARRYIFDETRGGSVDAVSLSAALSERTALRLGYGVSAGGQLDHGMAAPSADGLYWSAGELTGPHYGLLGRGDGFRLDHGVGGSTTVSFGWFDGDAADDPSGDVAAGRGSIGQATLDHRFADRGRLRLDIAVVDEPESYLGSQGEGAFAVGGAVSRFLTVSGGLPVGETIDVIGSFTFATTDMSGASDGLLTDWGTVESNAFGVGAVASNVFGEGDRLGFLAGQPLRVNRASASLTVPVALTPDETVVQESGRVDVTPSGREIDLQLSYDRPLRPGMGVSSWLMMQLEPGHDARADTAYGVGLTFRVAF